MSDVGSRQSDASEGPERRFVVGLITAPGLAEDLADEAAHSLVVRANRPWRLIAGLSHALVGAPAPGPSGLTSTAM
ncbi:hypothetical protein [Streptomyces sp. NPDC000880]